MHKPLVALVIITSLGSAGCAGFQVQHGSSLASQFAAEGGCDNLWEPCEEAPTKGAEVPTRAEQRLENLWIGSAGQPTGVTQTHYQRRGSDLWNSAPAGYGATTDWRRPASTYRLSRRCVR